jgi:hypothetical protein
MIADDWFESLTILTAESDVICTLSIDENEITDSFAVSTALVSPSHVDQSHVYTFSVAGIPKFL